MTIIESLLAFMWEIHLIAKTRDKITDSVTRMSNWVKEEMSSKCTVVFSLFVQDVMFLADFLASG